MTTARFTTLAAALGLVVLTGCATPPKPYDYTAFRKAKPASLLVMPPLNDSPDVKATPSMWSHATLPLSEAGYYVLPVTLVDETLRQNGIDSAAEAQSIPFERLREQFGADAAVYIKVRRYGTTYAVIASETTVAADAKVIDLRTGELLWEGSAQASSAEQQQQSQGGLAGLLIGAVVRQIIGTASDAAYGFAGTASQRLLGAPRVNGMLPGPRSPLSTAPATKP